MGTSSRIAGRKLVTNLKYTKLELAAGALEQFVTTQSSIDDDNPFSADVDRQLICKYDTPSSIISSADTRVCSVRWCYVDTALKSPSVVILFANKKAAWSPPVHNAKDNRWTEVSSTEVSSHPSISAELAWYIYTLRRRSRGLGRRTQTATCTNTHRARAVAANSNVDAHSKRALFHSCCPLNWCRQFWRSL